MRVGRVHGHGRRRLDRHPQEPSRSAGSYSGYPAERKDIVGDAFNFEKEHPELFEGELAAQVGVYFSYETRNHTMFGSLFSGYSEDYSETLALLFRNAICAHTLFRFPESTKQYPVILLPSAAQMTPDELGAVKRYLSAGGKIIVTGPSALPECRNHYHLPTKADVLAEVFFPSVPDGIHMKQPDWLRMKLPPSADPDEWTEPRRGLYYHPGRASEGKNSDGLIRLCRGLIKPMQIEVISAKGFLTTLFQSERYCIVHLLAEQYEVDIDHALDSMRTHRSRVNYITKAEPLGTDSTVLVKADSPMQTYAPFCNKQPTAEYHGGRYTVHLPQGCAYAILRFELTV